MDFNKPIKLVDGKMGLIIRITDYEIGVQVPSEEDIRWIPIENVLTEKGVLIEK